MATSIGYLAVEDFQLTAMQKKKAKTKTKRGKKTREKAPRNGVPVGFFLLCVG